MTLLAAIVHEPIDIGARVSALQDPSAGAIATFAGVVRDEDQGKPVLRLDYEAYEPMAEAELRRIAEEVQRAHGLQGIAIVHRVGALEVGEVAVVVVTTATHRAQALAACAEAIDAVKRSVPIWKRQHHPDGAVWTGAESLERGSRA